MKLTSAWRVMFTAAFQSSVLLSSRNSRLSVVNAFVVRQNHAMTVSSSSSSSLLSSPLLFGATTTRRSPRSRRPLYLWNHPRHENMALYSTATAETTEPSSMDESFFQGELVSFSSVGHNGVGVAAIKVKDETISISTTPSSVGNKNNKNSGGGQGDDLIGQSVKFTVACDDGSSSTKLGLIVAQRHPVAFVMCDFDSMDATTTTIEILKTKTTIDVSRDLVGKVVDCFGKELLSTDTTSTTTSTSSDTIISSPIFNTIPLVSEIALINEPLLTGVTAIDALTPIGKGQNMLIIGSDTDAQRSLLMDLLTTQVNQNNNINNNSNTTCVYACTTSDEESRRSVLSELERRGLSDRIVTVATRHNDNDTTTTTTTTPASAAEAVSVASAACSVAETWAREWGSDTVVVVDVLDYHKDLWDYTTRALVDLYGVDSVVQADRDGAADSEMRAFYSALIQRAGKFNTELGRGSVTLILHVTVPNEKASSDDDEVVFEPQDFDLTSDKIKTRINLLVQKGIPLTAENLRKIQIPTPTKDKDKFQMSMLHVDDLISMSDGQVWFTGTTATTNSLPPLLLDVQRSVTRIGIGADTQSRADAPAMQALTGGIRFELAQAYDAIQQQSTTTTTADSQETRRKNAWLWAMHQSPGQVRTLSEECVALMAVKLGCLDKDEKESTTNQLELVDTLIKHVWEEAGEEMKIIDDTLDFSDEGRPKLEEVIQQFFDKAKTT